MVNEILDRVEELQKELWNYVKEAKDKGSKAGYQDIVTIFMLLKIAQLEDSIKKLNQ